MNAKLKKSNNVLKKRDVYTIVLKDLRSQFKVFGESLAGFREKAEERFNLIDNRFDQIDARFDRFEMETGENFEIVKKYLSSVSDDLERVMAELKEMKSEPKKIDFGRVVELEKEVEHLKKEVNRQGKFIQLKLCA